MSIHVFTLNTRCESKYGCGFIPHY